VAGRLITDNILLAYETTHFMHLRKGGRDGLPAVKLDMSKAFDRVEWGFLNNMMLKLGFNPQWVQLVMSYITSVTYIVKVNKNLTDVIIRNVVCARAAPSLRTSSSCVPRDFLPFSNRPKRMARCMECRFAMLHHASTTCSSQMTPSFS
jgi:hypothetical protein